jgi:asparagine synthase (glutamine-hydrolysing)
MEVIVDNNYGWKTFKFGVFYISYIGADAEWLPIIKSVAALGEAPNYSRVDYFLQKITGPGAAVMKSPGAIIAFVDHFRCYPLFYTEGPQSAISNNARRLTDKTGTTHKWHPLSAEEFAMTGYVTGQYTLIDGLKQLQAGERLIMTLPDSHLDRGRYYRYRPLPQEGRTDNDWVEELDYVMAGVTERMVNRAGGRPIRLTLSAGLDSRVLACKLHEANYENFETFSYGPPGNWEARGARFVAKRLGIPWRMVGIKSSEAHRMFWAPERRAYWDFSDGLSSQPNFQEYFALSKLRREGGIPDDVVLINGQSGDFITGGHVPKTLVQGHATVRTLLDAITGKHYALWRSLMTSERMERIEAKILLSLGVSIDDKMSPDDLASLYEQWECEERQVKWVIHAQRVNDFFGYNWQLPLWDIELARFFQKVPIRLKLDQRLYRLWLQRWDYRRLFRDFDPTVWRWPGVALAAVPVAKGVEFLFGKRAKQAWYELFFYWGHTAEHYAPYPYRDYFRVRHDIRNCIALNGRTWAKENGLPTALVDIGQG